MTEHIVKFDTVNDANGYIINKPFLATINNNGSIVNIGTKQIGKKLLLNESGSIEITDLPRTILPWARGKFGHAPETWRMITIDSTLIDMDQIINGHTITEYIGNKNNAVNYIVCVHIIHSDGTHEIRNKSDEKYWYMVYDPINGNPLPSGESYYFDIDIPETDTTPDLLIRSNIVYSDVELNS